MGGARREKSEREVRSSKFVSAKALQVLGEARMQFQSVPFISFLTSAVLSCDVASNLTPRRRHEAPPVSGQQSTAERTMRAARTQPSTESPLGSLQGKAKAHLCWGQHQGWQRKRQNVAHKQRPHSHETQMQSASKIPSPHTAARTSLVIAAVLTASGCVANTWMKKDACLFATDIA